MNRSPRNFLNPQLAQLPDRSRTALAAEIEELYMEQCNLVTAKQVGEPLSPAVCVSIKDPNPVFEMDPQRIALAGTSSPHGMPIDRSGRRRRANGRAYGGDGGTGIGLV